MREVAPLGNHHTNHKFKQILLQAKLMLTWPAIKLLSSSLFIDEAFGYFSQCYISCLFVV